MCPNWNLRFLQVPTRGPAACEVGWWRPPFHVELSGRGKSDPEWLDPNTIVNQWWQRIRTNEKKCCDGVPECSCGHGTCGHTVWLDVTWSLGEPHGIWVVQWKPSVHWNCDKKYSASGMPKKRRVSKGLICQQHLMPPRPLFLLQSDRWDGYPIPDKVQFHPRHQLETNSLTDGNRNRQAGINRDEKRGETRRRQWNVDFLQLFVRFVFPLDAE